MKKETKKIFIFLAIFFTLLTILGVHLWASLHNYLEACPVITLKDTVHVESERAVFVAEPESTLSIDEFAHFEKAVQYGIQEIIVTDGETDAHISADGQSLFTGSKAQSFDILIYAAGSNHERVYEQICIEFNK